MQKQAVLVSHVSDCANLGSRIKRAHFGGVSDAHHTRLRAVNHTHVKDLTLNKFRRQLAVFGGNCPQLETSHFLWCATFIRVNVGGVCTNHGFPAFCASLQRNHVGTGAIEDRKSLGVLTKLSAHQLLQTLSNAVFAIGNLVTRVHLGHRRQNLGMHPRIVIAREGARVYCAHAVIPAVPAITVDNFLRNAS